MRPWEPTDEERKAVEEAIVAARQVQTFLWGEANGEWGLEEWLRMFRKRVAKLEEVKPDNPHAGVELRKRLLQTAALSVALIGIIDRDGVPWEAAPGAPPSNLPEFAQLVRHREVLWAERFVRFDVSENGEAAGQVVFFLGWSENDVLVELQARGYHTGGRVKFEGWPSSEGFDLEIEGNIMLRRYRFVAVEPVKP